VVIVIDEAQNLSPEALEQVRLLTNLETSKHKLLQIVLLGQPELRDLLRRRSLRQLAQRITARYHLTPLGPADTGAYVKHRMRIAGAQRNPFRNSALRALYQRSNGVPRLINIIADRALLGAFASERTDVNAALVHASANEVQLGEPGARRRRWPWVAAAMAIVIAATALGYLRPWQSAETGAQTVSVDAVRTEQQPVIEPLVTPAAEVLAEPQTSPSEALPEMIPVAEPEPALTSLDEQWLSEQNRVAWSGLAGLWGNSSDADVIQASCDGERGLGFACLEAEGSWSRIRQLGLPVLLRLPDIVPAYLLLSGIDGDRVLLGGMDSPLTATRAAVEEHWLGAYVVAWPQASGWPIQVGRGDRGQAVDVVMELASGVRPPWTGGPVFDAAFER
jgi:general secretion pathway protein A